MTTLALIALFLPPAPTPVADLAFEMVGNRIYLPAKLNGVSISAIFDTGAGGSVVELGIADERKLPGNGRVQAGGVGATQVTGRILEGASVEVGGQAHPLLYAIPFAALSPAEGRKLELILGHDFINRFVFEVDYAAKRMKMYPSGTKLLSPGTEVPIRIVNGHPHIRAKVGLGGAQHEVEAMIDTGASGGGLTGRFTKAVPIPPSVKTTASTIIGGGVGGFVTGRFLRLDDVDLGGIKVKSPVVSVNEGKGGANGESAAYDYLLGAEILKHFTLTIDYPNKRIFFKPNADFGKPFEADKTGIRLTSGGPDLREFTITGILPGSSAEAAGLKAGDKLVSINGMGSVTRTLQEWRDYLRESGQATFDFVVERAGEKIAVKVEAKAVI